MRLSVLVFCFSLAACSSNPPNAGSDAAAPSAQQSRASLAPRRRVILMVGDGMGPGQLEAARLFRGGPGGSLDMDGLPGRGQISTASLSGITDSAASATTMATGVPTLNGFVGVGPDGRDRETLVERARALGLSAGVVTTSYVSHATPGSFTAHRRSRTQVLEIAEDQARRVQPDVLLGGGQAHFLAPAAGSGPGSSGLITDFLQAGHAFVTTKEELVQASTTATRLVGLFANEHLEYVIDRPQGTTEPRLVDMALAALQVLDRNPAGFFLVIEGARIDMASHENRLERAIGETLDFDETVAAVAEWAKAEGDVTLLVTADHECGGLSIVEPSAEPGRYPKVQWRWGQHTNALVSLFAQGPGSEWVSGVHDFVWLHELMLSRLEDRTPRPVERPPLPDGRSEDMRHLAVAQSNLSAFGPGQNQLDALWVDANAAGLALTVEGLFEWNANNVVFLIDSDFGEGTGVVSLREEVVDRDAPADAALASLPFTLSGIPGLGLDAALVVRGGEDPRAEELLSTSGLRGVFAPAGSPNDLAWLPVAVNYGEKVRTRAAQSPVKGEGLDVLIPWTSLYPAGALPPGATLGVAVVLVNGDGGFASNQTLPPLPATGTNPGRAPLPLPAVVRIVADANGDGLPDGHEPPRLVPTR